MFAETGDVFPLGDAPILGKRSQHVLDGSSPQAGEQDNAEGDQVGIIAAHTVIPGSWLTVCEGVELGRVSAGLGQAGVDEEEKGEQVE